MATRNLDIVLRHVGALLGDNAAAQLCRVITRYVAAQPAQKSSMLSYRAMAEIAGVDATSSELATAITILVNQLNVLEVGFVYVDSKDVEHHLEQEEITSFLEDGELADPNTGDSVDSPSQHVFPYYVGRHEYLLKETR